MRARQLRVLAVTLALLCPFTCGNVLSDSIEMAVDDAASPASETKPGQVTDSNSGNAGDGGLRASESSSGETGPTEVDNDDAGDGRGVAEVSPLPGTPIFPDGLIMLVLIVKDEATSIEAVIRSSMAHMDSWYIMDTGSTDGTQEIIHRVMADYPHAPGVLEELPFVDFATTRNIALKRSGNGTMFKFFIDGDWYLDGATELRAFLGQHVEPYKRMMSLSPRGCTPCLPCFSNERATEGFVCGSPECLACGPTQSIRLLLGSLDYYVPRVIRSTTQYEFVGVVHEVIGPHASKKIPRESVIIVNATDTNKGHSKDRWFRDEKLLEEELRKDPNNPRTAFYLAQTYDLIDKPLKAYHMNWKRAKMWGWEQEAYVALHRAGRNALEAGLGGDKAIEAWLQAYTVDHTRCESLFAIGEYYKEAKNMKLCSLYAHMAVQCDYPAPSALFIKGDIYNYSRWDLLGICAWYTNDYEVGFNAVMKALEAYPTSRHTRRNLRFYIGKVDGAEEAWRKFNPDRHDEL